MGTRGSAQAARYLLALLLAGCAGQPPARPPYAEWRRLPLMPTAEREGSRAVIGGRLYLFSGFHTADIKASRKVQVYDPATARWSERAPMPFALTHANAVTVGDTV